MTPDPASEPSKPLFEPGTEVLIKTLGSGGPSLEPLWEGPDQVILSSPTAVKVPGMDPWVHHTLRGGTLTRTKRCHFMSLLSMLWLCTFQMGLIIYVSLLMLTPKPWVCHLILKTMPSCPGLTPTLHSTIRLTAGSVDHSLLHLWKASHGGHLHFKKRIFSKSANTFNNRMRCLFLNWWHLTNLKWTDVTMDIMWLIIVIIPCLSLMTILLHIRQIGLDLIVFYLTFIKYGMRLYG